MNEKADIKSMDGIHEHIEKLLTAALTDGFVTEKERSTIRRIAQREGMDPDEAEMLLDARLQELNMQKKAESAHKKCPHCGAEIPAFSDRCPACGSELRDIKATSSVKELFDKINECFCWGCIEANRIRNYHFCRSRHNDPPFKKFIFSTISL